MTSEPKTSPYPLPTDSWSERVTKRIARTVNHHRKEQGWTTPEFAALCSRYARDPDYLRPSTLSNLFAGKRKTITITEVLIFAEALRISPVALIAAIGVEDDSVEMWSEQTVSSAQAFDYLVWPLDSHRALDDDFPLQSRVVELAHHFDMWREVAALLPQVGARLRELGETTTPEATALVDSVRSPIRMLKQSRVQLWQYELNPTALEDEYKWIDEFDDVFEISEINLRALLVFASEQQDRARDRARGAS
jgi:transcriptional regulator with XRE-family HTH domain